MALAGDIQAAGEDIQAVADYSPLEDTLLEGAVVGDMAAVFQPCFTSFCLNANVFFRDIEWC